jgi:hypothetical protein
MRTLRYAISHKVPYIWIDQECINKEDEEEKRNSVQTMDIVYSRYNFPLGSVNTKFTDAHSIRPLANCMRSFSQIMGPGFTTQI